MSYFFFLFCTKMIRVICTMLAIIIEDLEMRLGNLNLPLKKSAIWFDPLAQTGETAKQLVGIL